MKKLVIFDFDGTIVDTSPGILYCLNTTALTIGYEPVKPEALYSVIGMPLERLLKVLYNMNDEEIEYATNNYSKMYSQKGKCMFTVYEGMIDAIKELKDNGLKLAIATNKHIMFVSDMLSMLEIDDVIDTVCATDVDTNMTKRELLLSACSKSGVTVGDSVFIGDSNIEAQDAAEIGMDFVAAMYGWGFADKSGANKTEYAVCANSASEIMPKILTL